jgi:hypothetical protein
MKIRETEWQNVWLLVLIVLPLGVSFSSLGEQFFLSPRELSVWIYGRQNPFVEANLMADKVRERTAPGEKIFVAGSEPQIYYFSQREAISQFAITYPLNIPTPGREDYQRKVIADLKGNRPAAIVVSPRPASSLWEEGSPKLLINYLFSELAENYYLAGGTTLNILEEPLWLEPQMINSQSDFGLLLYLKTPRP